MNCIRRLGAGLLLILALASCASTDNGARLMAPSGPVAFQVADRQVTVAEVEQHMREQFGPAIQQLVAQNKTKQEITDLANQQKVRQNLVDQMIQEELLNREAHQLGLGVDPKQVDEAVAQSQQASQTGTAVPSSDPDVMQQQRVTTARQQLALEVIARHIVADQFKSRHILVQTDQEAQQIKQQLAQGADFATLAKQKSQDSGSAVKGGELGWVARGNFVAEYEQVAFDEKNALNTPIIVKSQFGYHVIEIQDRVLKRPFDSFEQLRQSQNAQQLYSEQFLPWYTKLRQDAEARGEVKLLIDPNTIELPFPAGMP